MGKHSQRTPSTHSHGHSHGGGDVGLRVRPLPRVVLLVFLAACAVATVAGLVIWHPNGHDRPKAEFNAPGVTFPTARVETVVPGCGGGGSSEHGCAELHATLASGAQKGTAVTVQIPPEVRESGLRSGDRVQLLRIPAQGQTPASYSFFGVQRNVPLLLLALVFVLAVAAVARWRGLLAIVGLGVAGLVVAKFLLPALLEGHNGLGVALTGSAAIMFVVLYLAHGISLRTSTALAGTLLGIGATAVIGLYAVGAGRLSGVGTEDASLLSGQVHLDFQGVLMCAIIVAALGVLNDVTITQASAVWELRAASPQMSRRSLFRSAMRIGRDHIASTIYTLVFAYAGASLAVLLLVELYDRPLLDLLNSENIAEEVMRTLASALGLVLAVPITTAIGVLVAGDAD